MRTQIIQIGKCYIFIHIDFIHEVQYSRIYINKLKFFLTFCLSINLLYNYSNVIKHNKILKLKLHQNQNVLNRL